MIVPSLSVELALGVTPFGSWAWDTGDVSADVRQRITIRRGRRSVLGEVEPGRATVTLDNRSRVFDPENEDSIQHAYLLPMAPIRIRAVWDEDYYPLFQGFVLDWRPRYLGGTIAYIDLVCVDGFEPLSRLFLGTTDTPLSLDQDSVGQRIIDTLDAANWPGSGATTGPRSIDVTSALQIQAIDLEATPALDHLQTVARTVDGVFFISVDGKATFQDRSYRDGLSSVGTFSDIADGSELPCKALQTSYGASTIYNRIELQNRALPGETRPDVVAEDATSQAAFLTRTFTRTSLLMADAPLQAETQTIADQILGRFKDPKIRAERIEPNPIADPAVAWPVVLAADISTRLDIHRVGLNGGSELELTGFVEGIDWNITQTQRGGVLWEPAWDLSSL
jgi:hypothetical protein